MIVILIILAFLCGYLALRLFLIKRNVRFLTRDFCKAKGNLEGEQHLQISSPDKELEALALLLNEYIEAYSQERYRHQKTVSSIRNEITNLSHDLRTPITSILGYLDFLEDGSLSKDQAQALEVVMRRARDLAGLVEQLYEYARLENEDYSMSLEMVDLYKMVQEHLLSFYQEFEHGGIGLDLILPAPQQPIWVLGDRKCMERVLSNLTSNALKYGGGGIRVSLNEKAAGVQLEYRTLRGELSEYDIAHLFDRYYKKDSRPSALVSSGLGLTIAKLYMERMKGDMKAWGEDEYLYIRCNYSNTLQDLGHGRRSKS